MNRKPIGILLIGQTPRADLMALLHRLAHACDLLPRGALDALEAGDLPDASGGSYPLVTRLRDGTQVTVDEAFLSPLLQEAIEALEREGVMALLLLCAGPFPMLTSTRPLIRPFQLAAGMLRSVGRARVGIVVPTDDQRVPSERKWTEAGLKPVVWSIAEKPAVLSLERWLAARASEHTDLSVLVFDYVGYPLDAVQRVQTQVGLPVMDLGHLAVAALEAMILG